MKINLRLTQKICSKVKRSIFRCSKLYYINLLLFQGDHSFRLFSCRLRLFLLLHLQKRRSCVPRVPSGVRLLPLYIIFVRVVVHWHHFLLFPHATWDNRTVQLRASSSFLESKSREKEWRLSFTGWIRISWMGNVSRISNKAGFP